MVGKLNKPRRNHSFARQKEKRNVMKQGYHTYLKENVSPSLTNHDNTPHFLMELSKDEYKTLANNCLHLSDVLFNKGSSSLQSTINTTFGNMRLGNKINFKKVDDNIMLNMDRCRRRMVLITLDKSECDKCYQDVQILNTKLMSNSTGSGVVVLMMAIKGAKIQNSKEDKRIVWARLIIEMCEHSKKNILDSKMITHHSSKGQIYSFGYQGIFKQVKNGTVGLYEVRKRYKDDRQDEVANIARTIEDMIGIEMHSATQSLSKMVGHVDKLILPALDIANKLQPEYGDIFLKKNDDECSAMWHTNVCINASTGEFHTEKDTSYTLITVPSQGYKTQKNCGNVYNFLFKLNEDNVISLPLTPDLSFLFSATFLSHRQEGNESTEKVSQPFVNLSSYGNHKLFTHIRKSFCRNIND